MTAQDDAEALAEYRPETYGLQGETLERMAPMRHGQSAVSGADRTLLLSLVKRHLKMVPTGRPDEAPEMMEVDARQYLDPAIFAAEKKAIFDRYPVVACLGTDIPNPGDYVKLDELETPMFVTRTKSGEVKAFVNACRHRGAAIVYDQRGSGRSTFTCPYHGWTYDQDGKLFGVPCASAFDGMERADFGLVEVPSQELHGIVFVSPRADVPLDLDAHLGPELKKELGFWGFDKVISARSEPIVLPGNWKLAFDTFLESYHFAAAHKNNLAAYFNSNVQTVDTFGKNFRVSVSMRTIIDELGSKPEAEQIPENYLLVAYILFPGMIMINSAQVLEVFRIFPQSVDKTIIQHACYSRLPLDVEANAQLFEMIWQSAHNIVQNEDFPYGVTTAQKGLASGAIKKLVFGRNELPVQLNYKNIAAAMAG